MILCRKSLLLLTIHALKGDFISLPVLKGLNQIEILPLSPVTLILPQLDDIDFCPH